MKPGKLIRLNRQLCVLQPKSNPYRLKLDRPVPLRDTRQGHGPVPALVPEVQDNDARGKNRRGAWFWAQLMLMVLSLTVALAIVAGQHLQHRRLEYQLATQLRKQEESFHHADRLNSALVAEMKRLILRAPGTPELAVQPASLLRPMATNHAAGGRL